MHLGVADHFGWAVVVVARADGSVVDRRRIELIEAGLPAAPVHHRGGAHPMHDEGPPLDDDALAALVAEVRAAISQATATALDELAAAVIEPIESVSLRAWPQDFPTSIATQRRVPHESRADAIMYRQVVAEAANARGWRVHHYDAKEIASQASQLLGADVLTRPRQILGPPWTKDHRTALAAAIVAARRKPTTVVVRFVKTSG